MTTSSSPEAMFPHLILCICHRMLPLCSPSLSCPSRRPHLCTTAYASQLPGSYISDLSWLTPNYHRITLPCLHLVYPTLTGWHQHQYPSPLLWKTDLRYLNSSTFFSGQPLRASHPVSPPTGKTCCFLSTNPHPTGLKDLLMSQVIFQVFKDLSYEVLFTGVASLGSSKNNHHHTILQNESVFYQNQNYQNNQ